MMLKRSSTVCFLDWDDTLMFTTEVMTGKGFSDKAELGMEVREKLSILDRVVSGILKKFARLSIVKIVSNAERGWMESSCLAYFPLSLDVIKKFGIEMISARDEYAKQFPDNPVEWKARVFHREVLNSVDVNADCVNVIVVGDDVVDAEAAKILDAKLPNSIVKTVKFQEKPTVEMLLRQISLLNIHFPRVVALHKSIVVSLSDTQATRT